MLLCYLLLADMTLFKSTLTLLKLWERIEMNTSLLVTNFTE